MNTLGEIKTEVLVQLGVSTTVGYYTDDILNRWIDDSHKWAAAFRKWPFTEKRDQTTSWSGTEEVAYPSSDLRSDTIRLLQIGGKRLRKINFEHYQRFREDNPSSSERLFSDYSRTLFINPYADVSGTLTAFAQYTPSSFDFTDPSSETVFSIEEEDGNAAILEDVLSKAKTREKKMNEAQAHQVNARTLLTELFDSIGQEQFLYDSEGEGMWERIDVLNGGLYSKEIKRDQF